MEKDYYEILEVNKNASPEVIEKAYKALVKKYHPDLQTDDKKVEYQELLKQINEAYEVLSDPAKREDYDRNYESYNQQSNYSDEDYENMYRQNEYMKQKIEQYQDYENTRRAEDIYNQQKMDDAINQAYHDAYIQDLKNRRLQN